MELSVPINNINTQNIYFIEKKKNVIVDGEFVKILYSTDIFEMNGLYIFVELQTTKNATTNQYKNVPTRNVSKRTISLNPGSIKNINCIERLCEIETEIVERYIASYCPTKTASYILKPQLLSGTIKYHHSDNKDCARSPEMDRSEATRSEATKSESIHTQFGIGKYSQNANVFKNSNINTPNQINDCFLGEELNSFTLTSNPSHLMRIYNKTYYRDDATISKNYGRAILSSYFLQNEMNASVHPHCPLYYSPVLTTEKCILKISGIWETATSVGIAMKFILLTTN
jgi:hypothetical protein